MVGTGAAEAAEALAGAPHVLVLAEAAGPFARLVRALAAAVRRRAAWSSCPTSPDGRDLAPALAHALGRPLLAGALAVRADGATCTRWGGRVIEEHTVTGRSWPRCSRRARGRRAGPASAAPPRRPRRWC